MKKYPFRPKSSFLTTVFLPLVLLLLVALMGISVVVAQEPTPNPKTGDSNPALVAALAQSGAQISYHNDTGTARFIGATAGRPISQPTALRAGATGEEAARGFLAVYGSLFGINDQSRELVRENEKKPDATRTFERFQQVYNSIPVVGGELIVQVDGGNNILSANGEVLPKILVSATPAISADTAVQNALKIVAREYSLQISDLTVTTPVLWIYNPILITPYAGTTQLVWRMEVTPKTLEPIRELVLIDAQQGGAALHFNQIDDVLSRQTYTANNGTALPGVLVCNESIACPGGDLDAIGAHNNAGTTYNFYFNRFGRNSINNAGLIIKSTVHYRSGYDNAFWNGAQMVYGDANPYARADDVVAHELTHGVTQYESGLLYYYQSGAINESFSDVFGEFVDQTDSSSGGNDTPGVKWLIAEDAVPGGLRSMSDPTVFGDPDKMTSPNYNIVDDYKSIFFDNGGVHTNSGINNKAAFLITDGGTFNGHTVTGIGVDKAAKIYYEVQTNLLTSGSDYGDLYNYLYQACFNVLGGTLGITVADCQQVRNATDAVEMNLEPLPGFNPEAPLCPAGQNPDTTVFSDNMEAGAGNWSFGATTGTNHWRLDSPYGGYAHSGVHFLYGNDWPDTITASFAAMKSSFIVPTNAYLHFAHAFGFEFDAGGNYDGGILQYSTNNGATWTTVPSGMFEDNGYNDTLFVGSGNPFGGQFAFVAASHGYISSRVNLSSLVGQSVRFRWQMGLDLFGYGTLGTTSGWWLDDVRIYNCGTPPANDDFANSNSIPSLPYSITPTNAAASLELVEQKATCEGTANIKNTVWYKYTATGVEKVNFVATGSPVVKGISVWTGSSLGNLAQVGCATGATATAVVNTIKGTVFYIRVGSSNGVGGNFTVQANAPLGPPVRNYFTTATPTLTWNRVSGATQYVVQVSKSSTFGTIAYTATVPASQLSVATDPLVEGVYYWHVRAIRGTVVGTFSAFDSFVVDLP